MVNSVSNSCFGNFNLPNKVSKVEREQSLEDMKRFYGEPVKMNLHQFALLHGDTFLKGHELEGGNAAEAIAFWEQLLQLWKGGKGLSPGFTSDEMNRALVDYRDVKESEKLILDGNSKGLQKAIQEGIKQRERYALLLRIIGKKGGSGHVFGCILEKGADQNISAQLLNKGDGAELHPILVVTETKDKRSYRYPPIVFKNMYILYTKGWEDICQRIVRYATENPDSKDQSYQSSEIYSIFCLYGQPQPEQKLSAKDAVTLQRSGTCSSQVAKLLLRSTSNSDVRKNKRLSFCARFHSFVSLIKGDGIDLSQSKAQFVVQQALQGFCVQIEKLQKAAHISDEEMVLARLLVEEVEQKLTKAKLQTVPLQIPSFNEELPTEFSIKLPNKSAVFSKKLDAKKVNRPPAPEIQPLTDPEKLIPTLQAWCDYLLKGDLYGLEKVHYVHHVLQQLPLPSEPFWDEVSVDDCNTVIQHLHRLAGTAIEEASSKNARRMPPMITLIGLSAFGIMVRLAYKIPELKLLGWKFDLGELGWIRDRNIDKPLFFEQKWEQNRFDAFREYFDQRPQEWKVIFALSKNYFDNHYILNAADAADAGETEDDHTIIENVLHNFNYLKQFFDDNIRNLDLKPVDRYFHIWDQLQTENATFRCILNFAQLFHSDTYVAGIDIHIDKKDKCLTSQKKYVHSKIEKIITPRTFCYPDIQDEHLRRMNDCEENECATLILPDDYLIKTIRKDYYVGWEERSLFMEVKKCNKHVANKLIISNVITLMRQYPEARSKDYFRQWVMMQLLHGDQLILAFSSQPNLIEDLRKELHETIRYFIGSKHNRKIALEWIRVAYYAETRLPKPEFDRLHEFCDWILNETKTLPKDIYKANCLKIIFFSHLGRLKQKEVATLLAAKCASSLALSDKDDQLVKWTDGAENLLIHHRHDICKIAEEEPKTSQPALKLVSKKYNLENNWVGSFPQFTQGTTKVNLLTGEITVGGGSEGTWTDRFCNTTPKRIHDQVVPFRPPFFIDQASSTIIAQKGTVIAHVKKIGGFCPGIKLLEHKKTSCPDPGWYFCGIDYNQDVPPLHLTMFGDDVKYWYAKDSVTVDFLIEENQVPIAYGYKGEIYRLNHSGESTGEKLINLSGERIYQRLIGFLKRFTKNDAKEFQVWVRDGKITSLYWKKHKLELKVDGDLLRPTTHPNYFLTEETLDAIPDAKVFRTSDGNILVGMAYEKAYQEKDCPAGPAQEDNFFYYPLCRHTGRLTHHEPVPFFHLFYTFIRNQEYSKAKELLDGWNPFSYYDESLLPLLTTGNYFHPSISALYSHLALHIVAMSERVTKEYWEKKVVELYMKNIQNCFVPHIEYAWRVISRFDCHRIPHDLQLTKEQFEKLGETLGLSFLLNAKKSTYLLPKDGQVHPPKKATLFYRKWVEQGTQNSDIWSKVRHNTNSAIYTRYNNLSVNKNFGSLYEDCINATPEKRKIILASLIGMKRSADCAEIPFFLRTVLDHPNRFPAKFPVEKQADSKENQEKIKKKLEELVKEAIWLHKADKNSRYSCVIGSVEIEKGSTTKQVDKHPITMQELPDCGNIDAPLAELRLVKTSERLCSNSFPLSPDLLKTDLAKSIFTHLSKAFGKRTPETIYQVNRDLCEDSLSDQIKQDQKVIDGWKEEILSLANWTPEKDDGKISLHTLLEVSKEQHRLLGSKKERFTWKLLIQAFLSQSDFVMTQNNPFLDDEKIGEIYEKMGAVFVVSSRIDQAKEALKALEQEASDQVLGTILSKQREYKPEKFPLFLAYEYMTGMMLRPNQVKLLKWIFTERDHHKRRELLVEFQAGGGKTKVISAILAFDAMQKGKLPVFFSLPALHDMTKKDLADSLMSVFRRKVKVLEITLERVLGAAELRHIRDQLNRWIEEGVCLQMVPETWHALNLALRFARKNRDRNIEALCVEIITFFKEKAFFIVDEAHRNAESLWQANIATGDPVQIPAKEQQLFINCYRFLLEDEVLKLKQNNQAMLTEDDLKGVLNRLADHLIQELGIDPSMKRGLLNQKEPFDVDEDQPLHYLARGLLSQILPAALKMVHSYDYGKGLKNEVEGPRYQRKPTTSQYECADLAAALSNQGLFQRGLDREQMRRILITWLNRHITHPIIHFNPKETPMAKQFALWVGKEGPQLYDLEGQADDDEVIDELLAKMGKNEDVVEEYLLEHLLPQIRVFPEKVSSTAIDLVEGCENGLLFSATMGIPQEYPQRNSPKTKDDHLFQAEVIGRACEEKNSDLHILQPSTPTKLFEDLHSDEAPFAFEGIIDIGGWNRDCTTQEVAEEFLAFAETKELNYDGAIFIVENLSQVDAEQNLMFLRKGESTPIELQGSDLKKGLKAAGIGDAEDLNLFKVYGASQCTGTDLKLTPTAKMIVTIGETTRLWSLIQGIMRARQFLLPMSEQTMAWVCPEPLIDQIPHGKKLCPADIFMWALNREAESIESRIVARAFQQIVGVVQAFVENSIGNSIQLFQRHKKAFVAELGRDLRGLYGKQGKKVVTKEVLTDFTNSLLEAAKVKEFNRWDDVNQIITETKELVPKITRPEGTPSKGAAQQKVQAKTKTKQKQKHKGVEKNQNREAHRALPTKQLPYPYKHLDIYSPYLIGGAKPLNALTKANFFDPRLSYLPNAEKTLDTMGTVLKKLAYFLVTIEEDGGLNAIAISQRDAHYYRKQIAQGPKWAERRKRTVTNREVALVSTAGVIAQHRMSEDNLKRIKESKWLTKILSDLNFLNGRIHHIDFFSKQIATWRQNPQFPTFWKWIQEHQATPEGTHKQAINAFLENDLKLEPLETITAPKLSPLQADQMDDGCYSDTEDKPRQTESERPLPPAPKRPTWRKKTFVKLEPVDAKALNTKRDKLTAPKPISKKAPLDQIEKLTPSKPIINKAPPDQIEKLTPSKPIPEPSIFSFTLTKTCFIAAAIFTTLSLSFAVYMGALPFATAIPIACALAILPLAYLCFRKPLPS